MFIIPNKSQWQKWSLPSKLTAIGAYVGILGIIFTLLFYLIPKHNNEVVLKVEQNNKIEIQFEFAVLAEKLLADGTWADILVGDNSTLYSAGRFQVYFKPNSDCYVYVLLYDSCGKFQLLFPRFKERLNNQVRKNIEYYLPGEDLCYVLDNNTGIETVFLVASHNPMLDIAQFLEKIENMEIPELQNSLPEFEKVLWSKKRGIAKIKEKRVKTYKRKKLRNIKGMVELLSGKGYLVRVLSFHHK